MPDLREVFEMVKQQTEPDLDSWSEQERRMRQAARKRKIGAVVLVAAIVAAVTVLVVRNLDDPSTGAATSPPPPPPPIVGLALLDLPTGTMTGTGIVPAGSAVDASPDGNQITYVDTNGGANEVVWVANADGSDQHAFNHTGVGASTPRWSPDGTQIVYQGYEGSEPDQRIGNLYVLDVSSGRITQITHLKQGSPSLYNGLDALVPTFSADGRSVLFTMPSGIAPGAGSLDPGWDIWSVPSTGGDPTLVVQNAVGPDVTPDGDRLAYSAVRLVDGGPAFGALYVANADGSNPRRLVDGDTLLPRWSPEGTEIAYADLQRNRAFVMDVATGDTHQILDAPEWPEWVNEDTIIVDRSG
jgi:Tol biopolymer transport system component